MKFSENWLRTLVDPPLSTRELADVLTFGGLEVELVEPVAPPFERVVVGEVLALEKHPNADRLRVCRVGIGEQALTVVCGAPNVHVGMKAPLALPDARLPGGLVIKVAAVRGVESHGMLCSAKELGLSEDASGLFALAGDATPGSDVRHVLDLDDVVFTTKPTPNRGDCLSLAGVAREVAALTGVAARRPVTDSVAPRIDDRLSVQLQAPQECPRYCGRLVRGVRAKGDTPDWMVRRLARSGIRSISPVVDITNYVMLELGQPLHAFDAGKLRGGITVRRAAPGESIVLLNGETHPLNPDFLVIADDEKPAALAGIMGGAATAVDDATRDIFLESAFFQPEVIAGKARVLGFASDSSYRFERGVDFAITRAALERATQLVLEICGGRAGPISEASADLPERRPVVLRPDRVKRLLGVDIPEADARQILVRLGFECEPQPGRWTVRPPSYRFDVSIEEDLVEELARVYGYDNIPAATPAARATVLAASEEVRSAHAIRNRVAQRDYHEIVTYSFVDSGWEADFCDNRAPVALANPIASQMSVMRSSLLGGLADCVAFNTRHKQTRVRIFEIGRCFLPAADGYLQPWRLGGAAYGPVFEEQWGGDGRAADFYDVKGDVETLFAPRVLRFESRTHPAFHPGKSARIHCEGDAVGWIGELHPRWQRKYDLPGPAVLFELDMARLAPSTLPAYNDISRFPPVRRDLAAVFDESIPYQDIIDTLRAHEPPIVADIRLFDVYRGGDVGKGKKSLAFMVLLQDTQKTLTDAEVETAVAQLREVLQRQFNAKLR